MEISIEIGGGAKCFDLADAKSIAIDLNFDGLQPQHFGADPASRRPMKSGEFVGRTRSGGSCNVDILTINPHCNGTHTETVGHIVDEAVSIGSAAIEGLYLARVVTVASVPAADCAETYLPEFEPRDRIISREQLERVLIVQNPGPTQALIVRTVPNEPTKKSAQYGETRYPPYFSIEAIELIIELGCEHLLVDLPSIDRMQDDGHMTNHHLYWDVKPGSKQLATTSRVRHTITEMIYVEDAISDGLYLLNLQIAAFESDVSPSRPILYPLSTRHK